MSRFYWLLILVWAHLASADTFRFHLLNEPHSLDPQAPSASGGNYVFSNIYRGLYRYHGERGLILEGAEKCERTPGHLTCQLSPGHKFSNGERVKGADYVRTLRRLIDPKNKSQQADSLFALKNARDIWIGKQGLESLGVSAPAPFSVRFDFSEDDPEFEYRLAQPGLSPLAESGLVDRENASKMVVTGPYMIKSWKLREGLVLVKNPNYGLKANPKRPDLEALMVDDDTTALRLYESGRLNFLRRLVAGEFPRYRGKKEFHQVPVARFDYVGFGEGLEKFAPLRKALIQSVDFKSFQEIFNALGPPGCPALPARLMDRSPCMKMDVKAAQKLIPPDEVQPKLEFFYSQLGGDDIARAAQWFQGQWKKNLKLNVELKGEEQAVYLRRLRTETPLIFRKGVSLDRPTCLAALEIFLPDSRENYIRFKDASYSAKVEELRKSKNAKSKKVLCRQAMEILMASNRLIPLGEMHFTLLASQKFRGWNLNELNQLDLTDLEEVP